MTDIKKYDHNTIQSISVKDLNKLDPDTIDFSRIRKSALVIKKYLQEENKDPYTICVKARGAMNSVSECIRVVSRMLQHYKTQTKREYSIAKLERADEWFEKNKPEVKITDGMRTTYAEMDSEYIQAKEKESAAAALLEYLRNKRDDFEHDLNLAKKKMQEDIDDQSKAGYTGGLADEEYEDVS